MAAGPDALQGCARCGPAQSLTPQCGELDEAVCPKCSGRFLSASGLRTLVEQHLGITVAFLRELAGHFAGPRLSCPGCGQAMRPVTLRGVPVDLCVLCGGMWCDPGELTRLGEGRFQELQPPVTPTQPDGLGAPASADQTPHAYCLFLPDLFPSDVATASRVLATHPRYTMVDAQQMSANAFGVWVTGLAATEAEGLQQRAGNEGIRTAMVDEQWLRLPPSFKVQRLEATPHALTAFDFYGHPQVMAWPAVRAISVGYVGGRNDVVITQESEIVMTTGLAGGAVYIPAEHGLRGRSDLVMEWVATDPPRRLRLEARRGVRERSKGSALPRADRVFHDLAKQVLGHGRYAAVGMGAREVLEGRTAGSYRGQRFMDRELAWLLWRFHGPGAAAGGSVYAPMDAPP